MDGRAEPVPIRGTHRAGQFLLYARTGSAEALIAGAGGAAGEAGGE
ncbi:hypothetical protein ACGFI9_10900 [Micromonospora sp. NPDC048930]